MAIGVSYTGAGGQRRMFELDGVPKRGSLAESVLAMSQEAPMDFMNGAQYAPLINALPHMGRGMDVPQMQIPSMADQRKEESGKVKVSDGDTADFVERKLAPNGSIVAVGNQLMLRGDESVGGGLRVYMAKNGTRGFYSPEMADPPKGGPNLSAAGDTENGNSARMDGNSGATAKLVRLNAKINSETGVDILEVDEFSRDATITPNGRVVSISGERKRQILRYMMVSAEYSVLPVMTYKESDFWMEEPECKWLAFGREEDLHTLDGFNEETSKPHFDANEKYKSRGGKPEKDGGVPVKVVEYLGGGGGKYEVRPFWSGEETSEKPVLSRLAFGTGAQLESWDGSKFKDNYDEHGSLLPDPPVKIVETATCTYNPVNQE